MTKAAKVETPEVVEAEAPLKKAKPDVKPVETPEPKVEVPSKASVARAIFAEETAKGTARKDIIARFISEAKLTKSGSATYFEKFRKAGKAS
jgi:hypothetical protein